MHNISHHRKKLSIIFSVKCNDTAYGESVYLLGNTKELGEWDVKRAHKLFTNERKFPEWESKEISFAHLPKFFEYKYLIKTNSGKIKWENFHNNRVFISDDISCPGEITECIFVNGEIFNEIVYRRSREKLKRNSISDSFVIPANNRGNIAQPPPQSQESHHNNIRLAVHSYSSCDSVTSQRNGAGQKNIIENSIPRNKNIFDIDKYLEDLSRCIEEIKKETHSKLKDHLKHLMESFRHKVNIDKELIVLIFIHFYRTGQIKLPDNFSTYYEYKHHHDPSLARSLYTYLLSNVNDENSLLIHSILPYIPTCLDYEADEY